MLVSLFLILSFVVSWAAVRYYFSVKELQDVQGRVLYMRQTMAHVQGLVNRCLQYRQNNSTIDPILRGFGIPLTNALGRGDSIPKGDQNVEAYR